MLVVFFVALFITFLSILTPPRNFEGEILITIPKGYSIIQTAELLEQKNIVKSKHMFRFVTQARKEPIQAGVYQFTEPMFLSQVIDRILSADYGDVQVVVTIPEGATNKDIKKIFGDSELDLDISLENISEGYLFPDTYHFFLGNDEGVVLKALAKNFDQKYTQASEGSRLDKSQQDIVIMASLIEKEAGNNLKQKQIISGILWKRLGEGKRLQVDAPFLYDNGAGIVPLTRASLQPDSGYNTYTRSGLTDTAIGNPGYNSLFAAMHPIHSESYFYLHASDGNVYYAKTYDGHLKNIRMYLR